MERYAEPRGAQVLLSKLNDAYAHSEVLVDPEWVEKNIGNPSVRVVEVSYDPDSSYKTGHVPGSVLFDWRRDMRSTTNRDLSDGGRLNELLRRSGVSEDTEIVLYGDFSNWFAAYAFWILSYYGVKGVRLMNGGRKKWLLERRPLSTEVPTYARGSGKKVAAPRERIRAYMDYVRKGLAKKDRVLLDARSVDEYTGKIAVPPEYPNELPQCAGHIPGAINIPWDSAINEDETFKSAKDLESIYGSRGVTADKEIIIYCRIGERSSHTWFALKYLLGFPIVKNYDGSWAEWGNSINSPVERGESRTPEPITRGSIPIRSSSHTSL